MDCWVIHHPPLDFHGTDGRGCRPWLCKHAPSSRTGADGPQAEERAIAADTHRIARVPCDEFFFSRRGSEKKHGLSGCKKKVPPNLELWVSTYSNSLRCCSMLSVCYGSTYRTKSRVRYSTLYFKYVPYVLSPAKHFLFASFISCHRPVEGT